jgi:hypothetical protein
MQTVVFNNKVLNQKKINDDILKNENGQKKFNTCEFRSNDAIEKSIKRCACQGGTYTVSGYQCLKRDIFNITPDICHYCSSFQERRSE